MSEPQTTANDPAAGRVMLGAEVWALIASPAPGADRDAFPHHLRAHLDWIAGLEDEGVLVVAGPLTAGPDVGPGSGIMVVRAADEAAARQVANQDPLVAAGLRVTGVYRWRINEGSLDLRLVLSRSAVLWR
ncbi:YciI family protein [Amnibacterium kyonggiense]